MPHSMCNPEANLGLCIVWVEQVQTFPFPAPSVLRILSQANVGSKNNELLYKRKRAQVPVHIFMYISRPEMC